VVDPVIDDKMIDERQIVKEDIVLCTKSQPLVR
jgi:hypothetical protein